MAHLNESLLQLHLSYWHANLYIPVLGILSACNMLFAILFSSAYNAQGSRKNTAYFGCGSRQQIEQKTCGLNHIYQRGALCDQCDQCDRVIASLRRL